MARIRTIKPEFWTSEQVVECSPIARLLFIGIWNFCDDYGNHPFSLKQLKMKVFPGDDFSPEDINKMLNELINNNLIKMYVVDNIKYFSVLGWHHQKIEKKSRKYPVPKFDDYSTTSSRMIDDDSPAERKGKESIGKEYNKEKYKKEKISLNEQSSFEKIFAFYPGKKNKNYDFECFKKAVKKQNIKNNDELLKFEELCLSAIENQIQEKKLKAQQNKFVAEWRNLSTWINRSGWNDEVDLTIQAHPAQQQRLSGYKSAHQHNADYMQMLAEAAIEKDFINK